MKLPYLYLFAAVLLTAAGHILFKYFSLSFNVKIKKPYTRFFRQFVSPFFTAGFILMAAAPLFYFKALESLELSIAYSFTALNQIAIPVSGIILFRERADFLRLSGIVLIAAGVAVWNL